MPALGLLNYLERVATDYEFRTRALAGPEASFQGYDLSGADREALRSRDHRVLGLLAKALAQDDLEVEMPFEGLTHDAQLPESSAETSPVPKLATTVELLLQLIPIPSIDADNRLSLTHLAAIHPLPGSGESLPPPPAGSPPEAAAAANFRVTVEAYFVPMDDGQTSVSYVPTIAGFENMGPGIAPGAGESGPSQNGIAPIDTTPRIEHIAQGVRTALPAERYTRLADLVDALEENDQRR